MSIETDEKVWIVWYNPPVVDDYWLPFDVLGECVSTIFWTPTPVVRIRIITHARLMGELLWKVFRASTINHVCAVGVGSTLSMQHASCDNFKKSWMLRAIWNFCTDDTVDLLPGVLSASKDQQNVSVW